MENSFSSDGEMLPLKTMFSLLKDTFFEENSVEGSRRIEPIILLSYFLCTLL